MVPKLWDETVEAHRREVREAILKTAAALVATRGLRSVTMSQIAEETGIGRATLYKYFSDVEAILFAWHERKVDEHLEHLAGVGRRLRNAGERLEAVLLAYALIVYEHPHDSELVGILHRGEHTARAQRRLTLFISALLTEAMRAGEVRDDISSGELVGYCMHSIAAAGGMTSKSAVRRLIQVIMAGLRRTPSPHGVSYDPETGGDA